MKIRRNTNAQNVMQVLTKKLDLDVSQGGPRLKTEEHQGDPLVINTIQLLAHKRALDKLLDMVETYKTAISSGELERMPPLAPPPHMPDVVPFVRLVK